MVEFTLWEMAVSLRLFLKYHVCSTKGNTCAVWMVKQMGRQPTIKPTHQSTNWQTQPFIFLYKGNVCLGFNQWRSFLGAIKHLYNWLSVGRSISLLVGWSSTAFVWQSTCRTLLAFLALFRTTKHTRFDWVTTGYFFLRLNDVIWKTIRGSNRC